MDNPRKKGAQPTEHIPTEASRAVVAELYAAGIPQDRIAKRYDICPNTLRKHYRAELDECKDSMIAGMVGNLYQDALNGDKKDREFWLKTIGRLSYAQPEQVVVHTSDAALAAHVKSRGIDTDDSSTGNNDDS